MRIRTRPEVEAKCKAMNKANQYGIELYEKLVAIFKPLVGQKIEKADGTLLAKIQKLIPELPCEPFFRAYKKSSNYSLFWGIYVSEPVIDDERNSYLNHEVSLYIGDMRDAVLMEIRDAHDRRTDYNADEVMALIADQELKKKAYEDVRNQLYKFDAAE